MRHRKLVVAGAMGALALSGGGVAAAAGSSAPSRTTVKESGGTSYKVNRFVQDKLRWNKDLYAVKSGGTLHVTANVEGPHTFTIVRAKDEPTTTKAIDSCFPKGICGKLAIAHGADPSSEGPPKFQFLDNGKGTNTKPNFNRPGDSAAIGFSKATKSVNLKITAKKGSVLHFMCLIHPWMQAKVIVG